MNIYIKALDESPKAVEYILNGNPEGIQLRTGSQWITYSVINGNELKARAGNIATGLAWDATFFGNQRVGSNYLSNRDKYIKPVDWVAMFKKWKRKNTKLQIRIAEFDIKMNVQIDDFNLDIGEGSAYGDIKYSVSFFEYSSLKVQIQKKDKKKGKDKNKSKIDRESNRGSTYTVKKGDCLWRIALKYYKKGTDYTKIYNANKEKIEATAKKYGNKSSKNGNLIFPGTKLKIP